MQQMAGMRHNMLRDLPAATELAMADALSNNEMKSPFPPQTPIAMAYVPYQQWTETYDMETAFPIGTIFPELDLPFRGGGSCA